MKRIQKTFLFIFIALVSVCVLSSCGGNSGGEIVKEEKINFYEVASKVTGETVNADNVPYYFTIGTDGSYCKLDTNPKNLDDYSSSLALTYIEDMNRELGLPEYLYEDMISTSYSQGKQTEEFEKISVTYSYHPDKGLEVTYKLK